MDRPCSVLNNLQLIGLSDPVRGFRHSQIVDSIPALTETAIGMCIRVLDMSRLSIFTFLDDRALATITSYDFDDCGFEVVTCRHPSVVIKRVSEEASYSLKESIEYSIVYKLCPNVGFELFAPNIILV